MRPYCSKQSLVRLLCVVFLGPALVRVSSCCLQNEREAEFSLAIFCLSRSLSASVNCLTARTVTTLTPEESVAWTVKAYARSSLHEDPSLLQPTPTEPRPVGISTLNQSRGQLVANGALQDRLSAQGRCRCGGLLCRLVSPLQMEMAYLPLGMW